MPCCLIGGWAVYHSVNERYRAVRMRDYLGSRDIDIGVPDGASLKALDEMLTRQMGFERLSFRYVKYLNYDTGEEIDPSSARSVPLHMLIELFVDAMVPYQTGMARRTVGFVPADEPALARVFADADKRTTVKIAGHDVTVPVPDMLLAMKINSVVNRTKDHKRVKDICDITALCLFSGKEREKLIDTGVAEADPDRTRMMRRVIRDEDIGQASGFLGIPPSAIRSIIDDLTRR